jgi:hypothetical protein
MKSKKMLENTRGMFGVKIAHGRKNGVAVRIAHPYILNKVGSGCPLPTSA